MTALGADERVDREEARIAHRHREVARRGKGVDLEGTAFLNERLPVAGRKGLDVELRSARHLKARKPIFLLLCKRHVVKGVGGIRAETNQREIGIVALIFGLVDEADLLELLRFGTDRAELAAREFERAFVGRKFDPEVTLGIEEFVFFFEVGRTRTEHDDVVVEAALVDELRTVAERGLGAVDFGAQIVERAVFEREFVGVDHGVLRREVARHRKLREVSRQVEGARAARSADRAALRENEVPEHGLRVRTFDAVDGAEKRERAVHRHVTAEKNRGALVEVNFAVERGGGAFKDTEGRVAALLSAVGIRDGLEGFRQSRGLVADFVLAPEPEGVVVVRHRYLEVAPDIDRVVARRPNTESIGTFNRNRRFGALQVENAPVFGIGVVHQVVLHEPHAHRITRSALHGNRRFVAVELDDGKVRTVHHGHAGREEMAARSAHRNVRCPGIERDTARSRLTVGFGYKTGDQRRRFVFGGWYVVIAGHGDVRRTLVFTVRRADRQVVRAGQVDAGQLVSSLRGVRGVRRQIDVE